MKTFVSLLLILIAHTSSGQDDQLKTDWANLKKFATANKNLSLPARGEKRVVFMGNSITESWTHADSSFFIGKSYINRGIGGQTTPQMLVRFRPDVIALKPSVVVILAGINDIAENNGPISLHDIFGNIISMVQLAKINKIKPVVCSVLPANAFPWRPEIKPADKIIMLNTMLSAFCKANNVVYVDYYSAMVDDKKGLPKSLSEDGVHPNLTGYKVMEALVERALKKALHRR